MSNYLKYLKDEIHSVVIATTNEENHPITCVIDMMLADESGLYFLTAKGKSFYARLKHNENISLTGMKGENTMSSKSITLRGKAKEIGSELLATIFEKNPYMNDIYPREESRKALTVFHIYEGDGEFFDLSVRPIFRESFSFGREDRIVSSYTITEQCISCGACQKVCPQDCIEMKEKIAKINQSNCLHCGNCYEVCPCKAVRRLDVCLN